MKKVYVVGNAKHYARFILDHELVDIIENADIVLFTGGEDVDPSFYGCKKHRTTYSNIDRDNYEATIFKKISNNQLVIGVCRGSQFLCVMNGGILVQNCIGHAIGHTHRIFSKYTDKVIDITSTHHQMQFPFYLKKNDYTILYTSMERLSDRYEGDKVDFDYILANGEPEIVLYHKENNPKCLAIQGHPEYMPLDCAAVTEINNIINKLLNEKD